MADIGLAFAIDLGSRGGDEAPAHPFGKNFPRIPIRLPPLFCWIAACLTCVALVSVPQVARAQCTPNPTNGGIIQNGGLPCTVTNNVTTNFGTAVDAFNSANVTTNGTVSATGFGTGISAATSSLVTVNGPVTADGLGLTASGSSRIVVNNIVLSNGGGGGARAMLASGATITVNGITVNWGSGGSPGVVEAQNGGLIEFTAPSTINNSAGGVPFLLGATGAGSRIIANGLTIPDVTLRSLLTFNRTAKAGLAAMLVVGHLPERSSA